MSETTEAPTEPTSEQTGTAPATGDAGRPAGEEEHDAAYWRTQSRRWEERAKRNADAARRWDAYQQSHRTEEKKRADELAALTKDRDTARSDARRARAAVRHGLTEDQLALIDTSGTDEDFEARAAALAEMLSARPARRRDPNLGREQTPAHADRDWLRRSLAGA